MWVRNVSIYWCQGYSVMKTMIFSDFLGVVISLNYGHVFLIIHIHIYMSLFELKCWHKFHCMPFWYFFQEIVHSCWWFYILLVLTIHFKMLYVQQTFSCTLNFWCLAKLFILNFYFYWNILYVRHLWIGHLHWLNS